MQLIIKCNACEPPIREWWDSNTYNRWIDKTLLNALPPSLHTAPELFIFYFWLEQLLYPSMYRIYKSQFTIYIYIYMQQVFWELYPYWIFYSIMVSHQYSLSLHLLSGLITL